MRPENQVIQGKTIFTKSRTYELPHARGLVKTSTESKSEKNEFRDVIYAHGRRIPYAFHHHSAGRFICRSNDFNTCNKSPCSHSSACAQAQPLYSHACTAGRVSRWSEEGGPWRMRMMKMEGQSVSDDKYIEKQPVDDSV